MCFHVKGWLYLPCGKILYTAYKRDFLPHFSRIILNFFHNKFYYKRKVIAGTICMSDLQLDLSLCSSYYQDMKGKIYLTDHDGMFNLVT